MSQTQASPAWASTAIGDLLCGRCQDATVRASTKVASYLSVPSPGRARVLSRFCPKKQSVSR